MAFPSLFQTLPMLIVEMIVEYLEGSPRNLERWRVAALGSICNNCEIDYNGGPHDYDIRYPALPTTFTYPQYCKESLVKLVIVFGPDWGDICSGKFNSTLVQLNRKCPVFLSATSLVVFIACDDFTSKNSHDTCTTGSALKGRANGVIGFVSSLRDVIPTVTGIHVRFSASSLASEKSRMLCNDLASELCRKGVTRMFVETSGLHNVTKLTSITQGVGIICTPLSQLAYLNAPTLKDLNISLTEESNWRTLIYGGTKTLTVYSSLTKLVIGAARVPYGIPWSAIDDAVPFPVLINLELGDEYPFTDDLLFRGNGGTLQQLRLLFCVIARNALGRFNVLGRCDVTRMSSIFLEVATKLKLEFMEYMSSTLALGAIESVPSTAAVRSLDLRDLRFGILHIAKITSALPSLVSLTCKIHGSASEVEELSATELLSTLRLKHYLLRSSFRHLRVLVNGNDNNDWEDVDSEDGYDYDQFGREHVVYEDKHSDYGDPFGDSEDENESRNKDKSGNGITANDTAVVAVQIAVLCPNTVHIELPKKMRGEFSHKITRVASTPEFKPYADPLLCLVYPD
ncbi:hypothetical protein GGI20_000986 [Coemansia sp. BCRC 34301]|nr:hypothetical protein GGI20_000986 [Coemansia sp. BCRC 34301]